MIKKATMLITDTDNVYYVIETESVYEDFYRYR